MSDRGKTLLAGHTLRYEGRACFPDGSWPPYWVREGCGKCSCGAISPVLPSNAARKRWHRKHKILIRAAQA